VMGVKGVAQVPPLAALMEALGLRVADVSAISGCGRTVIASLRAGRYGGVQIRSLVAVALAVGCAPSELVPGLDLRPVQRGVRGADGSALGRRVMARRARDQSQQRLASQLAERESAAARARVDAEIGALPE
jgi:hypothetical protein